MSLYRKIGDGWLDKAEWAEPPVAATLRACAKELVEAYMDPPVPEEGARVRIAGFYGVVMSANKAQEIGVSALAEWGLVPVLLDGGTRPIVAPVDRLELL